jgi:hypothetical protein
MFDEALRQNMVANLTSPPNVVDMQHLESLLRKVVSEEVAGVLNDFRQQICDSVLHVAARSNLKRHTWAPGDLDEDVRAGKSGDHFTPDAQDFHLHQIKIVHESRALEPDASEGKTCQPEATQQSKLAKLLQELPGAPIGFDSMNCHQSSEPGSENGHAMIGSPTGIPPQSAPHANSRMEQSKSKHRHHARQMDLESLDEHGVHDGSPHNEFGFDDGKDAVPARSSTLQSNSSSLPYQLWDSSKKKHSLGNYGQSAPTSRRQSTESLIPKELGSLDIYKIDKIMSAAMLSIDLGQDPLGSRVPKTCPSPTKQRTLEDISMSSFGISSLVPCNLGSPDGMMSPPPESYESNDEGDGRNSRAELVKVQSLEGLRSSQDRKLLRTSSFHGIPDMIIEEASSLPYSSNGSLLTTSISDLSYSLLFKAMCLRLPMWVLYLFGIVPVKNGSVWRWCGVTVPVLTTAALAYYLHFVFAEEAPISLGVLGIGMCSSIGALLGFAMLWQTDPSVSGLLLPEEGLLNRYAVSRGFDLDWHRNSFKSCLSLWFLWLTFSVTWVLTTSSEYQAPMPKAAAAYLGPIAGNALTTALMCCIVHVCRHLDTMVDRFCIDFFHNPDYQLAMMQWARLQAILRHAASSISACFLILQTSNLVSMLLIGVELFVEGGTEDVTNWRCHMCVLPNLFMSLICLVRAAAVTEKCSRVPALVNAVGVEEHPLDDERQYFVQFIEQSAAGFYVNGIRFTASMVLKLSYISGMAAFAFAAQILRE